MIKPEYNFSKVVKIGHWETKIDPVAQYGCFEHDVGGDGGGLWFLEGELMDADGTAELPRAVVAGIEQLGFTVGAVFK